MIITRTPFRITFGGGGTDLPSFYKEYGGFIFGAAIDKYMFISVNRPIVDNLVRVKYSKSETTESIHEVNHELARECCRIMGIEKAIEIVSMADIPAGTGLGSSSSYTVGLLNALHNMSRNYFSLKELAEQACTVEIDIIGKPIGKQDQYIAVFGGLTVLEIDKNGEVEVRSAKVNAETLENLENNVLLFYEGTSRDTNEILSEQSDKIGKKEEDTVSSMLFIKGIGKQILEAIEEGNVRRFGELLHEHWLAKKKISSKMTNPRIDDLYEIARENGCLGGKIMGAGGGGFFMFYCENSDKCKLRKVMGEKGLKELKYSFAMEGSQVLAHF